MNKIFPAISILVCIVWFVGCSGDSDDKVADSGTKKPPLASRLNSVDAADQQPEVVREQDVRQSPEGMPSGEGTSAGEMSADGDGENTQPMTKFGGALFPDFVPDPAAKTEMVSESPNDTEVAADSMSDESDSDPFDMGDADDGMSGGADSDMAAKGQPSAMTGSTNLSLLSDAKRLFQNREESDAINVLYAHHLISEVSRNEYRLDWYAGLKEPRLLFRWGVGVIYSAPSDYTGRLPVIGDPGDENEGGGDAAGGPDGNSGGRRGRGPINIGSTGAGGGSGGERLYKNIDTSRPDGFLLYYTGDFGTRLISELEKRALGDSPLYGRILHDIMDAQLNDNEEDSEGTQVDADQSGASDARAQSTGILGLGGEGGRGQPDNTSQNSDNSANAPSAEPPSPTVIERAMGSDTAAKPDEELTGSILPGVMLLGVGSKAELIERAQREAVDSLIVFNVNVSKSRGSSRNRSSGTAPPQFSTTSLKIIDIQSEKAANLFSSRALKDTDVQEKIDEGKDPVKIEIDRAFADADAQFASADLPSGLNPENVKSRIGRLLQQQHSNPLRAAVEIISFYEIKLLPEDLAIAAITRLFGSDEAKVLVNGSEQQRFEFLQAWLPDGMGA